jgi:excisionase family DNA binding protein
MIRNRTAPTATGKVEAVAPYLRPDEAAQLLGVSRRTLSNFQRRHLIGFSKLGRVVVFRRADIEAAVDRFRQAAIGE